MTPSEIQQACYELAARILAGAPLLRQRDDGDHFLFMAHELRETVEGYLKFYALPESKL